MYPLIKSAHSYFAWLALAAIVISVVVAFAAKNANKPYNATNLKTALGGLISVHLQLVIGLLLYFLSPNGFSNLSGPTMKDSYARLLAVEHPFINILGIILITVGYSKAKKALGTVQAGKTVMIYYGLGLLLILSRIPWSSWINL